MLNVLTVNHGNLTRSPKLNGRELKNWPMKHRPMIMQLQNSANILCIDEADAFLYPEGQKTKDLIKLFIKSGYKGIVLQMWQAKTIACFVRGGRHARVELLARYISTKAQNWSTTFGMFRCYFGLEKGCEDPNYDTPTSDCLATTGPSMSDNPKNYLGTRLPDRAQVQKHGKNGEIIVISVDFNDEKRGDIPKSVGLPREEYDHRHVTRADLPYATVGVFHIHPNITHGAAQDDFQKGIRPLVTEYQCDILTGDANKSANTFSRHQTVYNPEEGLMNHIMKNYQRLWNNKQPDSETRMDVTMTTSSTIKSIARHHIHTKTGSGFDRTFPDCMMTFVFGWERRTSSLSTDPRKYPR